MSDSYVESLIEARQKAWHEGKALLDAAAGENRDLTAEEQQTWDRINADLDRRGAMIEDIKKAMEREARTAEAIAGIETSVRPVAPVSSESDQLRSLANGDIRSMVFEGRAVAPASTGAPVPTSFYDRVIMKARLIAPVLQTSTVLTTTSGETLQIPSLSSWSTATLATATQAIGTSDPAFNAFTELKSYKYSFIVQVAQELLTDSGVNFETFLADMTANAIGYTVGEKLTVGTGTVEPKGIVAASSVGGTTAGTAVIAADDLINLFYSLDGAARALGAGWMMNGKTIGQVRQLKASTSGVYLWSPSLDTNTPDSLLGAPVYENPAMADVAAGSKSVIVGHLPSYYVRQVGGIALERSDDYAFNQGLATFRAQLRVDGNLPQTTHVKHLLSKS